MIGIERRAKRELFLFTCLSRERYSSLENYQAPESGFRALLARLLPPDWKISSEPGIWCKAEPPNQAETPAVGFKIHVSSVHERAEEILCAILPILRDEATPFKVASSPYILDLTNSSIRSNSSCGKFITIYPKDTDTFKRLLERLDQATSGFSGPYVLSDKRFRNSSVLFYRYGAFKSFPSVNIFGEFESYYVGPSGEKVRDQRVPYFELPEGISDPFPGSDDEEEGEPLINGRYKALKPLSSSAKGGVYLCLDLKTNNEVIVKEARPLINRSRETPYDAVDCLRNEWEILNLLSESGATPKPIEFFKEWEHSFIVMEHARGTHLNSYRAYEAFSLLLMTRPSAAEVQNFLREFLIIAQGIVAAMRKVHGLGVVINDFAPQNILFHPETQKITLVDFEAAYTKREGFSSIALPLRTMGFGSMTWTGEAPSEADDYLALGRILGDILYPVTPFFALAPENRKLILERVAKEKGVPNAFIDLIIDCKHPEKVDSLLLAAESSIEQGGQPKPPASERNDQDLSAIGDDIGNYIIHEIETSKDPIDLPNDYRRFVTNALSISYGAAGIAMYLKRTRGAIPGAMMQALADAAAGVSMDRFAPGLYIGTAGIAWTLHELGMVKESRALMDATAKSALLYQNADIFYGSAGWGLANLYFFKELGDEVFLSRALEASEGTKKQLKPAKEGLFYVNNGDICHGLCHGGSGIGYFFLRLYEFSKKDEHLAIARSLLQFELSSAEERKGHIVFRRGEREPVNSPYWRIGSAGIGAICLRYYKILQDQAYLDMARKIANYLEGKFAVFPTNFSGMTGIAGFILDMFIHTNEPSYREEVGRYIDRVMLFAIKKPSGLVFPGEELIRISTDYGTGSAGTGMLIHRVLTSSGIPYLDF